MRRLIRLIPPAAVLSLVFAAHAATGEEKIAVDKLPKPVLDAAKAKFPEATIVGAEKESEDGKVVYEVGLTDKGQKVEMELTADGKIIVIEKTIDAKDVPAKVDEALKARHPKARIKKVEALIKEDKVTAYELLVVSGRKNQRMWEVVFDPSGKFVKEEEKTAKEKEGKE